MFFTFLNYGRITWAFERNSKEIGEKITYLKKNQNFFSKTIDQLLG